MAERAILGVRIPAEVALGCEQGHRASITFITHRTLPSSGMEPQVIPLFRWIVYGVKIMVKDSKGACLL
jgi:hypothetical protein